jgi:hypothetical protein
VISGNEAEAGVERQVARDRFRLIDVTKDDALGRTPESDDLVIVGKRELTQLYHEKACAIRITLRSPAGGCSKARGSAPLQLLLKAIKRDGFLQDRA